jgi:alkylation response protein AidB-like acyl-CoA dehydrogenase
VRSVKFPGLDDDLVDLVATARDIVGDVEGKPATSAAEAFAGVGLPGLLVAEADGGLGMSTVALALVALELGRGAITTSVLETVLAAGVVSAHGADEVRTSLFGSGADGGAIALSVPGHRYPTDVASASAALVDNGGSLLLVPEGSFTRVAQPSTDPGRDVSRIDCTPGDGTLVSADPEASRQMQDRGAVAFAAYLTGLALRMTEDAAAYAKVREQFGRPIGAFQAVQHRLADAFALTETASVTVVSAAAAVDSA